MRKEKKLNPVKKLAKKTALRTAYQAQAHAKQAGQEIRGGASGEGPSDNYAQQKVEDKAKEAAEDAAGFAFRSTKIPYKMYRRLYLSRSYPCLQRLVRTNRTCLRKIVAVPVGVVFQQVG